MLSKRIQIIVADATMFLIVMAPLKPNEIPIAQKYIFRVVREDSSLDLYKRRIC